MESEAQKNITQIQGEAQAKKTNILANATSDAATKTIGATADAYALLNEQLGITPEKGLAQYIFLSDLQTAESVPLLYNVNKTITHMN